MLPDEEWGDAILSTDKTQREVQMADFLCSQCGNNQTISHGGSVQAALGLSQCAKCQTWTPFREKNNIFEVTTEAHMPVRVCPKCKAKTAFRRRWDWPPDGNEISALDSCAACGFVVYFKSSDRPGQKVIDQYPKIVMEAQPELPELVRKAYAEALICYGAGSPNGTLLMCRRAIQEAMNDKKAKKGDLPVQLQDLVDRRIITPSLQQWATYAQIGGRIAAHGTGGDKWGDPNQLWGTHEDAEAVIDFCKAFFDYLYTLEQRNQEFIARHQSASQSGPSSNAP